MAGLYPENTNKILDWISAGNNDTGYKMTNLTAEQNYITRLSKDNCPLYKNILANVTTSQALQDARFYYYNQYKSNLETLTKI